MNDDLPLGFWILFGFGIACLIAAIILSIVGIAVSIAG